MLVSQQVAAKMKKYNPSAHIGSTHIEGNVSMNDDEHLMVMVQYAVPSILLLRPLSLLRYGDNRPVLIHHLNGEQLLSNLRPTGKKSSNRLIKGTISQPEGVRRYPPSIH